MFNINGRETMSTFRKPTKTAEIVRAVSGAGYDDVLIIDEETASAVLTEKRRELIDRIETGRIDSVRGLAIDVDRDKAAVSRDLQLLFEHDLIDYEREGRRKVPVIKHETVLVEPVL